VTANERERLAEALARAMFWSEQTTNLRQIYLAKATHAIEELDRNANTGSAVHLQQALTQLVKKTA
jgi:hypothetical protein